MTRDLARFVSLGFVAYLPFLASSIVNEIDHLAPWWTPLATASIFVPAVAMGISTFLADVRWTARFGALTAAGFLGSALLWPLAWDGHLLDGNVWISVIPGLPGLAAALAWPVRWAIGYLLAAVVTVQILNHVGRSPAFNDELGPSIAFAMSFCLLFVAAELVALDTGRRLDREEQRVALLVAEVAAAEAKVAERHRFDELEHGWVLSCLGGIAGGLDRAVVRRDAQSALLQLDAARVQAPLAPYHPEAAAATVRAAALDAYADLKCEIEIDESADDVVYPTEVVARLRNAVTEAVHNSVKHAGEAERVLRMQFYPHAITATVEDTGSGFDTAAARRRDSRGLTLSIEQGIRQLPGGDVAVVSSPGSGTSIIIRWRRA